MTNYLIESDDYITIKKYIDKLIKENKFIEATTSNYDLDEQTLDKVIEDLNTYSLFSSKKIIIVKNIDKATQEINQNDLEDLYRYLKNPSEDNLLILTAKKLNNTLKFTKEIKKYTEQIKININANTFLKSELKDYIIEKDAEKLLLEYCQDDLTKLENDCNKLKNYRCDTKKISKQDVKDLCLKKLNNQTDLTFAFTRSIAEKDKKKALDDYNELLDYNIEPLSLIGLLASQFRIMYQVKILEARRLSSAEIGNMLKENPYRITKTKELTRYYSKEEILNVIKNLEDMDLKIKTTNLDPKSLIELFILNL